METLNKYVFYLSIFILFYFCKEDGSKGMVLGAIVFAAFAHLIVHNVVYAFILCILVLVNPNNVFPQDAFGYDFHFLRMQDIFFYASFIFLYLPYYQEYPISTSIRKLIPFLVVFAFYQIFVAIIINLGATSPGYLFKTLEFFKFWIFGIFIILPTYKIVRIDSQLFFRTLGILAIIFAIAALLSTYTSFHIMRIYTERRYDNSGMIRKMIQNTEIFKLFIFTAVGVYFIKYSGKFLFYAAGIMTLILPLIGMFRLELTYTLCNVFLVLLFLTKYYNTSVFKFTNIFFYFIAIVMIFMISSPDLASGIADSFSNTIAELMGKSEAGTTQTRTIIELPNQMALIKMSPYFGVGFQPNWWENYDNMKDWGLSDVPVTATIAMYGIIGMLIYYSRFYRILVDVFKSFILVKKIKQIVNPLDAAVLFALGGYFITMITFRAFYISWELSIYNKSLEFGILLGIFYALYEKMKDSASDNVPAQEPYALNNT